MKKMILSALVILSVVLISTQVFAINQQTAKKVLLISDIDDTIKVTHVISPNKVEVLDRTVELKAFSGMAQLYQMIINENINSTKVVYLSNAPKEILDFPILKLLPDVFEDEIPDTIRHSEIMQMAHELFLRKNKFPQGLVLLRLDYEDQNHKINSIRRLIKEDRPDLVIMVGDNGERDIEIYAQAALELNAAGIANQTYIHQVYATQSLLNDLIPDFVPNVMKKVLPIEFGKKIEKNQLGYVTPLEIAFDLKTKNLMNPSSLNWLNQSVASYILNEKKYSESNLPEMTFPSFMNCSEHKFEDSVNTKSEIGRIVSLVSSKCR